MTSNLEEVYAEVLNRITPNRKERERILTLSRKLIQRIKMAVDESDLHAEVSVEGSIAKDTWLSDEPDIDVFMKLSTNTPYDTLGTTCLTVAKRATKGLKQVERYAEHPYLESWIERVRVNIVPCYDVDQGNWISSTDRTPFHTTYINRHLNQRMKNEVRLLKQFMLGIGVYGSEIRIGGFSGYLCELLLLYYGSFTEVIKAASNWKRGLCVDIEGYYDESEQVLAADFNASLIVIDPVDKRRNVAAAVREDRFYEFVAAARMFLQKPKRTFFFPKKRKNISREQVTHAINRRGTYLVFLKFDIAQATPDVLWGQLYRTIKLLVKKLERSDFKVIRDGVWSDEEKSAILIFEVENRFLPLVKNHLGPPLEKRGASERFLQKYLNSEKTISGPRISNGRWIVQIEREHTDITHLLGEMLKEEERPFDISYVVTHSFQILVNEEIVRLYSLNNEFIVYLLDYLKGRPSWLN